MKAAAPARVVPDATPSTPSSACVGDQNPLGAPEVPSSIERTPRSPERTPRSARRTPRQLSRGMSRRLSGLVDQLTGSIRMARRTSVKRRVTEFRMKNSKAIQAASAHRCIVFPYDPRVLRWDKAMIIALLFTVFVTPFEAAFLKPELGVLFWINRAVDVFFLFDMVLQFCLAYRAMDGKWITAPKRIARRYLRTWFAIDIISIIPFDAITVLAERDDLSTGQAVRFTRMLRLARLLKMASRVTRSKRLWARVEESLDVSYASVSLGKFAIIITLAAHWISCLWRLVLEFQVAVGMKTCTNCWMEQYTAASSGLSSATPLDTDDVFELYGIALYWAISALSTIGFGDAANPANSLERAVAVIAMVVGSTVWAYVMGKMAGVISSFDENTIAYEQRMDKLNQMSQRAHLPKLLRHRLRTYFAQKKRMTVTMETQSLLHLMSPRLRGEVALHISGAWLKDVTWVMDGEKSFVACIALALEPAAFETTEAIAGGDLNILLRGVVVHRMRVVPSGHAWGHDMILANPNLRSGLQPARALTFVECSRLSPKALEDALKKFPTERKRVRTAALWMALRRSAVHSLEHICRLLQLIFQARRNEMGLRRAFETLPKTDGSVRVSTVLTHIVQTLHFVGDVEPLRLLMWFRFRLEPDEGLQDDFAVDISAFYGFSDPKNDQSAVKLFSFLRPRVITWHKHWERQNFASAVSHVKSSRDLLKAHSSTSNGALLRQTSIRTAIGNAIDITPCSTPRPFDDARVASSRIASSNGRSFHSAKVANAFPPSPSPTAKTVKVSCGGHLFEFSAATIRKAASPGSLLRGMVDSAGTNAAAEGAQPPFLDRAHDLFSHVLNWHRNGGHLPCLGALSRATLLNLQEEANYFCEPALLAAVRGELELKSADPDAVRAAKLSQV